MPFISNMKKPACASKVKVLELATSNRTFLNIINRKKINREIENKFT